MVALGAGCVKAGPPMSMKGFQEAYIAEVRRPTLVPNLWLVPSDPDLAGAEVELVGRARREFRLRDALRAGTYRGIAATAIKASLLRPGADHPTTVE